MLYILGRIGQIYRLFKVQNTLKINSCSSFSWWSEKINDLLESKLRGFPLGFLPRNLLLDILKPLFSFISPQLPDLLQFFISSFQITAVAPNWSPKFQFFPPIPSTTHQSHSKQSSDHACHSFSQNLQWFSYHWHKMHISAWYFKPSPASSMLSS